MFLIAGLGNPGPEYRATRHNVGFMTVETLATRHRARWRRADRARIAEARVKERDAILVEPQTFMNCSGEVLAELRAIYDVGAMVVVFDDLDLPLGRLRVRPRGGSGGHRGVASIIESCGHEFARVRIGIGRPRGEGDPVDFVLGAFAEEERTRIGDAVETAADAVECVVECGVEMAMNRFNAEREPGEGAM